MILILKKNFFFGGTLNNLNSKTCALLSGPYVYYNLKKKKDQTIIIKSNNKVKLKSKIIEDKKSFIYVDNFYFEKEEDTLFIAYLIYTEKTNGYKSGSLNFFENIRKDNNNYNFSFKIIFYLQTFLLGYFFFKSSIIIELLKKKYFNLKFLCAQIYRAWKYKFYILIFSTKSYKVLRGV